MRSGISERVAAAGIPVIVIVGLAAAAERLHGLACSSGDLSLLAPRTLTVY
jgi:hypothetical protein